MQIISKLSGMIEEEFNDVEKYIDKANEIKIKRVLFKINQIAVSGDNWAGPV